MPAERQRDRGDRDQQAELRRGDEADGQPGERDERAEVEHVLARQHQRRGLDPRGQLQERDDRAGEGDRADEDADEHLGVVDAQQVVRDRVLCRALASTS